MERFIDPGRIERPLLSPHACLIWNVRLRLLCDDDPNHIIWPQNTTMTMIGSHSISLYACLDQFRWPWQTDGAFVHIMWCLTLKMIIFDSWGLFHVHNNNNRSAFVFVDCVEPAWLPYTNSEYVLLLYHFFCNWLNENENLICLDSFCHDTYAMFCSNNILKWRWLAS